MYTLFQDTDLTVIVNIPNDVILKGQVAERGEENLWKRDCQ